MGGRGDVICPGMLSGRGETQAQPGAEHAGRLPPAHPSPGQRPPPAIPGLESEIIPPGMLSPPYETFGWGEGGRQLCLFTTLHPFPSSNRPTSTSSSRLASDLA